MNFDIDINELDREFNEEENRVKGQVKMVMQRAGETYVATSREKGSYHDVTGNLRNANGYAIAEKGKLEEVVSNRPETNQGINQQDLSGDISLILANGMDYATHVEAKGYDVASSGHLAAERVVRRFL